MSATTKTGKKSMGARAIERRNRLKEQLLRRERALREEVDAQRERPFSGPTPDPASTRGDEGDAASADVLADLKVFEAQRDIAELEAIHRALARIDGGGYGVCEKCGAHIAYARLKANPTATHCAVCQTERERTLAQPPISTL